MKADPAPSILGVALVLVLSGAAFPQGSDGEPEPLVQLLPRLSDATVSIHGQAVEAEGQVSTWGGAGVLIHPAGYVLTNHHVAGRGQLAVVLADGSGMPGRWLGGDAALDVGLVRIDAGRALPSAVVLRDHGARLGEEVIVVGSPNNLSHTVTTGIVSRVGGPDLQVSAAINSGNSGGPVFDRAGRLIGVVKAKGGEGMGFAIPIRRALERLPEVLLEPARQGWELGLRLDLVADRFEVVEGSAAEAAGLRAGDSVRGVDGRETANVLDLFLALIDRPAERPLQVEVERDGERRELLLEPRPVPLAPATPLNSPGHGIAYRLVRGTFNHLPDFDGLDVAAHGFASAISLDLPAVPEGRFGLQFQGYVEVPADGAWTFHLRSDDGSALWIDGHRCIDNDGLHAATERSTTLRLAAGFHALRVDYFEQAGDQALSLEWSGPGVPRSALPRESLRFDGRRAWR